MAKNIMKIAYFDASSGISGDMTVAALLDAGAGYGCDIDALGEALRTLSIEGYELHSRSTDVGTVAARSFEVSIVGGPGEHHHRTWRTIRTMIEEAVGCGLSAAVAERSIRVFQVLAEAEGKVHGSPPDDVHFHEVGAVDSIVDIVGVCWCLDRIGVEACFVGPLPSGSGFVESAHGRLPVPAPATQLLLRGFEVLVGDGEGELVTPTGAALLQALAKPLSPLMRQQAVGMGAGTKRWSDRPNVLRVLIGEVDATDDEAVVSIECDIDDMTPAALAFATEALRQTGAIDVTVQPVAMKKNRLGQHLTVLARLEDCHHLADAVLSNTTTIGVRYAVFNRRVLPRRLETVSTRFGDIQIKVVARPDGSESGEPEFSFVALAAERHQAAFADVHAAALEAWYASRNS